MARRATPPTVTAGRDQAAGTDDLQASEDLAATVGMWSSLAAGVVLGLSMVVFVLVGPWKDLGSYAAHAGDWKFIGIWVLFFLLTVSFVPAVAAVHAVTPQRWRLLSLTAFGFAVMYAAICSANCVLQFSFVRQQLASGNLAGLEPWTSASPNSALFVTDNLGFFLQGIATLALAPLFGGSRLMNAIKWLFILNGVSAAAGLVLISVSSLASPSGQALYTVTVLVWGIVLAVALLLLAVAFRRRLLLGFHDRKAPQPAAQ